MRSDPLARDARAPSALDALQIEWAGSPVTLWSALGAAVLWALTAPAISNGISSLPERQRVEALMQALWVALAAGALALSPILFFADGLPSLGVFVPLAGLLTFVVATLLYYMTAYAFTSRAELASQFARVKPLFSVALGGWVLGEAMGSEAWLSTALVCVGLLIFGWSAARGHVTWTSLCLGLTTAAAWAFGELFVGLGFPQGGSAIQTWVSLMAALLAMTPLFAGATIRRPLRRSDLTWLAWFAAHGVLSFAFAYSLFFHSIVANGLVTTVLVTAFWPALAMVFSLAIARIRKLEYRVAPAMWWAAALLLAGSLVEPLLSH